MLVGVTSVSRQVMARLDQFGQAKLIQAVILLANAMLWAVQQTLQVLMNDTFQALIFDTLGHDTLTQVLMNDTFQALIFDTLGHTQTVGHALLNDTWRCDYVFKTYTSSVISNVLHVLPKSTESSCSLPTISDNSDKTVVMKKTERKRDREPSRIPVHRVLRLLKRRFYRKCSTCAETSVPKSSFIRDLCNNFKNWYLWFNSEHFYCKMCFFLKKQKYETRCKCMYVSCKQEIKSDFIQNNGLRTGLFNISSLKGGMPPENVSGTLPWTSLIERLSCISLMPYDVGGSGDCFFKSVSHQLYGTPEFPENGVPHDLISVETENDDTDSSNPFRTFRTLVLKMKKTLFIMNKQKRVAFFPFPNASSKKLKLFSSSFLISIIINTVCLGQQ